MSGTVSQRAVIEQYFDGFRRLDHAAILACLTEDVVWDLVGYTSLHGKAAFDQAIEHEDFSGSPLLDIDRILESATTATVIGTGAGSLRSGATHRFAFCDVFTFEAGLIARVESYLVPLTAGTAPESI